MQRASCVSCHRRKLKCSRQDEGCSNCRKSGQACEYPAAEARARGKRGPYQKRTTQRERDLGEELKATEAKYKELASRMEDQLRGQQTVTPTNATSEEYDSSYESCISSQSPYPDYLSQPELEQAHPKVDQMFQLWHVFVTKVHPVTCLVHRPSLENKIFTNKTGIHAENESLSTLMYSIYFAAVTSTISSEALLRFGEEKGILLDRFQTAIERCLAVAHVNPTPDFMTLQALVLYIICFRRQEGGHQVWPLFGLAVRMAQLLHLGSNDADAQFTPFEIQYRRRIWWTICWLEKRCAEDIAQQTSIMSWGASCTLPFNFNDIDLDPYNHVLPLSRIGIADNTFCLMRFEMLKLFFKLHRIRPDAIIVDEHQRQINLMFQKETFLSNTKARLERDVMQYCSGTRPFDWLVMKFVEAVMSKAELVGRRSGMTENEAFRLSLVTMKSTYMIQTEPIVAAWAWVSRDYVQSHSLVKLVSELCKGTESNVDRANIDDAWRFIELVVARIPAARRRDPSVSPIINLMALARQQRASSLIDSDQQRSVIRSTGNSFHDSPTEGSQSQAQPLQSFPDAWAENAIGWGNSFLAAAVPDPETSNVNEAVILSQTVDVEGGITLAGFSSVDPAIANIDWTNWDCSPDVFNTTFGPA